MFATWVINLVARVVGFITFPVQLLTTSLGGCLVGLTFGLLLWPFSIVWIVFFMEPLLVTSWLWDRAPLLRLPLAVLGVPWAVLGGLYVSLLPPMGEFQSRATKLLICWTWPFSLDFLQYQRGEDLEDERWSRLQVILGWNSETEVLALPQTGRE